MRSIILTYTLENLPKSKDHLYRGLFFFLFFMALLLINKKSYGQCEMKFEYEVENCTAGKSDGKIYLKLINGEGSLEFKLFDLRKGKFINIKKIDHLSLNNKILLFEGLYSSNYEIEVNKNGCDPQNVGGSIKGIVVGLNK